MQTENPRGCVFISTHPLFCFKSLTAPQRYNFCLTLQSFFPGCLLHLCHYNVRRDGKSDWIGNYIYCSPYPGFFVQNPLDFLWR